MSILVCLLKVGGDDGATQYSDLELNKLVLKVGGDDGATQYSDLELNKLNANTDWQVSFNHFLLILYNINLICFGELCEPLCLDRYNEIGRLW